MMKAIRALMLSVGIVALLNVSVYAADQTLYVRDGATGTDCSTWESDKACDAIATAEALVDRATYDAVYIYVADGTYGACTFNAAASGTKWAYVHKATMENHGTDTGWDNAYGDGQAEFTISSGSFVFSVTTGYWEFNGKSRSTATTGHGFKLSTTTPTAVLFRPTQPNSSTDAPTNIRLLYTEVAHMGRQYNNWTTNMSNYAPIYFWFYTSGTGTTDGGGHYLGYNYIHDSPVTLAMFPRVGSLTLENNYFEYSASYVDDVPTPENANCTASETPWPCCTGEGTGTCSSTNQGSGIVTYCGQGLTIKSNVFKDVEGSCGVCLYGVHGDTDVCPNQVDDVAIYNNVFYQSAYRPDNYHLQNGIIAGDSGSTLTNVKIYENTFANMNGSFTVGESTTNMLVAWADVGTTGNEFKNNILYKNDGNTVAGGAFKGFTKTNNWYYGNSNNLNQSKDADWSAGETGAVVGTGSPFTDVDNSDFTLAVGSTAINAGADLGASYNTDILGISRPQGAAFDIGAYEYTGGGGTTYTVTPSATNCTISPAVDQETDGTAVLFTMTGAYGYTASGGGTCGGSLSSGTYTTSSISADCTVTCTGQPHRAVLGGTGTVTLGGSGTATLGN